MFELNSNSPQPIGFFDRIYPLSDNAELMFRAVRLFNKAISRGRFARIKRRFTRTPGDLLNLDKMPGLSVRVSYYGGLHEVPLKKVRGSLGRITDFDCDFNPRTERLRDRWQSVAMAYLHNLGLQPVELIQVGEEYFVQDGHHRISVARALGQVAIEAEVIVWDLNPSRQNITQPAGTYVQAAHNFS